MRKCLVSLGFTAAHFPTGTHMRYIHNDDEERREAISRFVENSLRARKKVGSLADGMSP